MANQFEFLRTAPDEWDLWGPRVLVFNKALTDEQIATLKASYEDGGWSLMRIQAQQIPGGIAYDSEADDKP